MQMLMGITKKNQKKLKIDKAEDAGGKLGELLE